MWYALKISIERQPLLHSLHIPLQPSRKPICQLVLRNLIRRLSNEQLRPIIIIILRDRDQHHVWLLPKLANSPIRHLLYSKTILLCHISFLLTLQLIIRYR